MRKHFEFRETAVTIEAADEYVPMAEKAMLDARSQIEEHIAHDDFFRTTFDPYPLRPDMSEVVRRMCVAAEKANVGPMATVAGAIAEEAVLRMIKAGCTHCMVDNGGDIAMRISRPVTVGLYTGEALPQYLGLEVPATRGLLGVCTSSGTVGPSISLGVADLATVISPDVALADACATKLGNMIRDDDPMTLERALRMVLKIEGVQGALVMVNGKLGMGGDVPRLVRCQVPKDKITRIHFHR
ncbi:MAG: UPF0280 family protein [Methanomassiliicoccales archaeon]|nr:UPF0280 family protein [Methanomassiliicoccales archaeon]